MAKEPLARQSSILGLIVAANLSDSTYGRGFELPNKVVMCSEHRVPITMSLREAKIVLKFPKNVVQARPHRQ